MLAPPLRRMTAPLLFLLVVAMCKIWKKRRLRIDIGQGNIFNGVWNWSNSNALVCIYMYLFINGSEFDSVFINIVLYDTTWVVSIPSTSSTIWSFNSSEKGWARVSAHSGFFSSSRNLDTFVNIQHIHTYIHSIIQKINSRKDNRHNIR